MLVRQVLQDAYFHTYHLQKVQAMGSNDFVPRVKCCRLLLGNTVHVPHLIRYILFWNECTFTKDGISTLVISMFGLKKILT
jgi:hypothetical protein